MYFDLDLDKLCFDLFLIVGGIGINFIYSIFCYVIDFLDFYWIYFFKYVFFFYSVFFMDEFIFYVSF